MTKKKKFDSQTNERSELAHSVGIVPRLSPPVRPLIRMRAGKARFHTPRLAAERSRLWRLRIQGSALGYDTFHYAHIHDAEGYRLLYEELDNLNDGIRKELFSYSKEIRSHLEEKEWKKLTDSSFLNTFLHYLKEGV